MAAAEVFSNQPFTVVTSGGTDAPSSGTTQTWTVASSAPFPSAATGSTQFHVTDTANAAASEIIAVTNVSGTTWTVTRGAESTTPVAHAAGFTITQVITAGWLGGVGQLATASTYTADQFFKSGRPWVSVASLASGGSGTKANPWTGWESAFNALGALGGQIFFDAGWYTAAQNLTVTALNMTVTGSSPSGWFTNVGSQTGGSVIQCSSGVTTLFTVAGAGGLSALGVTIRDLTINGAGIAANAVTYGSNVYQHNMILGCLLTGFTGDVVTLQNTDYGNTIKDNIIRSNAGWAIRLGDGAHATRIVGNTFYDNAGDIDIGYGTSIPPNCVWVCNNNFNGTRQASGSIDRPAILHERGKAYIQDNYIEADGTLLNASSTSFITLGVSGGGAPQHTEVSFNRFNHQSFMNTGVTLVNCESPAVVRNNYDAVPSGQFFLVATGATIIGGAVGYDNYGTAAREFDTVSAFKYYRDVLGQVRTTVTTYHAQQIVQMASSSDIAFICRVDGLASDRFRIASGGDTLQFGPGNGAPDTNLYRAAAGTLKTDNSFAVGGVLSLTNPLAITQGGTGGTTATAYAVVTGGTASTSALQQVSGVGTSGYVLTSNGAGALPAWLPATGGSAGTAWFNVRSYGATGNGVQVTDGAMGSASTTLACTTSTPFSSGVVGQVVVVQGAGVAGADLVSTISAYTNTGHVTLAGTAQTTVSATPVTFGTDDTTAMNAAMSAAVAAQGGAWYAPAGIYVTTAPVAAVNMHNGIQARGDGLASLIVPTGSYDALSFTTGTGLVVQDLQISSALSAPTAGAGIAIASVADYRILDVSSYGTYWGLHTTGGTSKSSNSVGCYFEAVFAGFYAEGSFTLIGSHFGGGTYGAILNSGSGHSARMVRVGLYGPLPLTTWNTSLGTVPNKTVWLQAVECNYQTGTGSPFEGTGGMNLDNCGGDIHIEQCWLSGTGLTIGGGNITTGGRKDTACTITAGNTTIQDSSIGSGDNGASIAGWGIPTGGSISSVSAGNHFVVSVTPTISSGAGTGVVNVGGTTATINPTWVDIIGGIYSANNNGATYLVNGIHIKAGKEIAITGCLFTGSADHTLYDDILIDAPATGPISVTGCNFSGNTRYLINSAGTVGPYNFSSNTFYNWSAALPVNYPAASVSEYTILGNTGAASLVPAAVTAGVFTLTDASTIAVDASQGNHFRVTIAGDRTLGNPTNPTDGQKVTIDVIQGSGGSHLISTYGSAYIFSTSLPSPTLSTSAGAVDVLAFLYDSTITKWRFVGFIGGFSS